MTRYAGNAEALRALVREQEVHRDVYVSEEVFQLEMEHMFPNSWVYVGHESEVPSANDYVYIITKNAPASLAKHNFGRAYMYISPQRNDTDMGLVFGGTAGFPRPTYMSLAASSYHAGGVNSLFGDGSVRFVKSSVSPVTWRVLGSIAGGEVTSADQF